jgi:hypothetical protein
MYVLIGLVSPVTDISLKPFHHHHQPTTVHCWAYASPISRHLARSSATRIQLQPSCANRHSTWPEDVPHYVYLDAVSTPEFVTFNLPQRLSVLWLIWPAHCHFSMLIRCAMSVTLVKLNLNLLSKINKVCFKCISLLSRIHVHWYFLSSASVNK